VDLAEVLLLLPVELLLVAPLLRRPRRRPRKRVCYLWLWNLSGRLLTQFIEKEESDEDMGFGLFD
jgi:hypothetical protein